MRRRSFIKASGIAGSVAAASPLLLLPSEGCAAPRKGVHSIGKREIAADLVIAGGGLGGVACALSALESGLRVVMTEETPWIGGQLTAQGVPPDEHRWIETHGATRTYRRFRERLREYYRRNYPLTPEAMARPELNPGNGAVSRLCVEPKAGVAVLFEMLAPWLSSGKLTLLLETRIIAADAYGDRVQFLEAENRHIGERLVMMAPWFVDATELGDLLPLTGTEYVKGTESKGETGELHAPEKGDRENQQAFTLCFAMEYLSGRDCTIDRPAEYDFWRSYVPQLTPPWPGRLLDLTYTKPDTLQPKTLGFHPEGIATGDAMNLWNYRRIIDRKNFTPGFYDGDITIVNWPQNDYHITNGCYRLHPVEWNIGESVGMLVAYARQHKLQSSDVRESPNHLADFQKLLTSRGVELHWPS